MTETNKYNKENPEYSLIHISVPRELVPFVERLSVQLGTSKPKVFRGLMIAGAYLVAMGSPDCEQCMSKMEDDLWGDD